MRAIRADAFDHLKALREARERFDVVILDPPAFVKRKKDFAEGRLAYRRLNELGMQVLAKDGILITCSCSYHMPRAALLDTVQQGARHLDRQAQALIAAAAGAGSSGASGDSRDGLSQGLRLPDPAGLRR